MEITGKLYCADCGSNCELSTVKPDKNIDDLEIILCNPCIEKREEETTSCEWTILLHNGACLDTSCSRGRIDEICEYIGWDKIKDLEEL